MPVIAVVGILLFVLYFVPSDSLGWAFIIWCAFIIGIVAIPVFLWIGTHVYLIYLSIWKNSDDDYDEEKIRKIRRRRSRPGSFERLKRNVESIKERMKR